MFRTLLMQFATVMVVATLLLTQGFPLAAQDVTPDVPVDITDVAVEDDNSDAEVADPAEEGEAIADLIVRIDELPAAPAPGVKTVTADQVTAFPAEALGGDHHAQKSQIFLPMISGDGNTAATTAADGESAGVTAAATDAPWTYLLRTSFEAVWPPADGLWQTFDRDGATNGEYCWNDTNFAAYSGSWSIWPAAGCNNAVSPLAGYPPNTNAMTTFGPFSLAQASQAKFEFRYWNNSEPRYDFFSWCVSPDNITYYCRSHSGVTRNWKKGGFNLKSVPGYGSVLGDANVWIGFLFTSDSNVQKWGAFVDDVSIQAKSTGVTLEAVADAHVRTDYDILMNDNNGLTHFMLIGTNRISSFGPYGAPDAMRALVRFDTSSITTSIKRATLELTIHHFNTPSDFPFSFSVHRITQPWIEGNGITDYAWLVPGSVHPDPANGVAWAAIDSNNQAQPASDVVPLATTQVFPNGAGAGDVVTWDVTAIVQQWIRNPASNYGLMVRVLTSDGTFREFGFGTHEGDLYPFPNRVRGPRLIIQFK